MIAPFPAPNSTIFASGLTRDEMREQRRVERNTVAIAALVKLDPAVEQCINRLIVSERRNAGAKTGKFGFVSHSHPPLRAVRSVGHGSLIVHFSLSCLKTSKVFFIA